LALLAGLLVIYRPPIALGLALCAYGIEQLAMSQSSYFVAHPAYVNYAVGVIVLLGLLSSAVKNRQLLGPFPMNGWVIAALLVYAYITFFWAIYLPGYQQITLAKIPYFLVFTFAVPFLIKKPEDVKIAVLALIAVGLCVIVVMFFDPTWEGRRLEIAAATAGNDLFEKGSLPLPLARVGGYVAIVAALLVGKGLSRWVSVSRWLIILFALAFIFKTGSRGQLLACVATIGVLLPFSRGKYGAHALITWFAGGATLAVVVSVAASFIHQNWGRWRIDHIMVSITEGRLDRCIDVLQSWVDGGPLRWLIGLGSSASYSPSVHGFMPEVMAVEVLTEEGFIGFGLLVAAVVLTLAAAWRCWRIVYASEEPRSWLVVLVGLFMFKFALSFKESSLMRSDILFGLAILVSRYELLVSQRVSQVRAFLSSARGREHDDAIRITASP
jgi:hypothetical protein